ncbi:hypothetical protein [Streptomyces sp. NPDC002328]|uniref:hypothetical protein n=1 Tax=Streptomyces sp. NPDC002328 TaxID=3364642 RepID=UPI0036A709BF
MPGSSTTPDAPTLSLCRVSDASDSAPRRYSLAGEDVALVRPYVLAWEQRARPRPVVVAPRLSAEAWSSLAGVQ